MMVTYDKAIPIKFMGSVVNGQQALGRGQRVFDYSGLTGKFGQWFFAGGQARVKGFVVSPPQGPSDRWVVVNGHGVQYFLDLTHVMLHLPDDKQDVIQVYDDYRARKKSEAAQPKPATPMVLKHEEYGSLMRAVAAGTLNKTRAQNEGYVGEKVLIDDLAGSTWVDLPYQDGVTDGRFRVYHAGQEVLVEDTYREKPLVRVGSSSLEDDEWSGSQNISVKMACLDYNVARAARMWLQRYRPEAPEHDPYKEHRLNERNY